MCFAKKGEPSLPKEVCCYNLSLAQTFVTFLEGGPDLWGTGFVTDSVFSKECAHC